MVLFKGKRKIALSLVLIMMLLFAASTVYATDTENVLPSIEVSFGQGSDNVATSIQILVLITILSLAPSILIMMTSFTRFIIVFSFLRRAISLQSTPPNQVLIALAIFMTLFVMAPVFSDVVISDFELPSSDFSINEVSLEIMSAFCSTCFSDASLIIPICSTDVNSAI